MLHVRKLGEGFVQRGYHYKELQDINEVSYLSECDVLYISNHFCCDFFHKRLAKPLSKTLFRHLQGTQARLVLWNFHTLPDLDLLQKINAPILHLGEDLYPETIDAEPGLKSFRNSHNVLQLRYATPTHPHFAKLEDISKCWDMNFVGNGYRRSLTQYCNDNYRAFIRNTPPSISEPQRVNSFRQSEVNLVFHSDGNVEKGVVVERFSEALAFGGIILHDHPRISKEFPTLKSLALVKTSDDIRREFSRIMSLSTDERVALRQASFDAWRFSGLSYFDQAKRILDAF